RAMRPPGRSWVHGRHRETTPASRGRTSRARPPFYLPVEHRHPVSCGQANYSDGMAPESSPDESAARAGWALGLAIGLGVGVSLGAALHNIGVGIAIGAGIGTAFAVAFSNGMRKRARSAASARDARSRGILVIGEALVDRVGETGEEFP